MPKKTKKSPRTKSVARKPGKRSVKLAYSVTVQLNDKELKGKGKTLLDALKDIPVEPTYTTQAVFHMRKGKGEIVQYHLGPVQLRNLFGPHEASMLIRADEWEALLS